MTFIWQSVDFGDWVTFTKMSQYTIWRNSLCPAGIQRGTRFKTQKERKRKKEQKSEKESFTAVIEFLIVQYLYKGLEFTLLLFLLSTFPLRGWHKGSSSSISPIICILLSHHLTSCPLQQHLSSPAWQVHPHILLLSLLWTGPHRLSLPCLALPPKHLACAVPLMNSFLILSILVSQRRSSTSLISATCGSASCLLLSATISKPNSIAALTTTSYTFLDSCWCSSPPVPTCFFTSFPQSPLLWTVELKYVPWL